MYDFRFEKARSSYYKGILRELATTKISFLNFVHINSEKVKYSFSPLDSAYNTTQLGVLIICLR